MALGISLSEKYEKLSLVKQIKRSISLFESESFSFNIPDVNPSSSYRNKHNSNSKLRKAVNSKLAQDDVSAAVRLIASDDTLLEPYPEYLEVIRSKHPHAPLDLEPITTFNPEDSIFFTSKDIQKALSAFHPSSSGGIDGLRPSHVIGLTSFATGEFGIRLLSAVTSLCKFIVSGNLSSYARKFFFADNLTALRKKDGGIRPIAVGNVFRRLASKAACRPVIQSIKNHFSPVQLSVSVPEGCEAAAHAVRSLFLKRDISPCANAKNGMILVKLDRKNAFNTIRRDHFLKACFLKAPTLYQLAHHAYATPSDLLFGSDIIQSQTGIQQGDLLGPLLFALGVDEVARNVSTPLSIWYLDDANLGGSLDCVRKNLDFIIPALSRIGLSTNPDKSEIINIDCNFDEFELAIRCINGVLPGVRVTHPANLQILGSPILESGIKNTLSEKRSILSQMSSRPLLIDSHPALFLLRNCFFISKLL